MTKMKRVSVSLPDDVEDAINNFRNSDEVLRRSPYSASVRYFLRKGMATLQRERSVGTGVERE